MSALDRRRWRLLAGIMLAALLVGIVLVGRSGRPAVDPPASPEALARIARKNDDAARAAAAETRRRAGLPPSPRLAPANGQ